MVQNGGVIDATANPLACIGNWCANGIANGAGTTGSLTIDGSGSEIRLLRNFMIANAWVDNGFGTPGGIADATLTVSNGGVLRTQATDVGSGFGGSLSNGQEQAIAHVSVTGSDSHWVVGANAMDGWDATLNLSNHARAQSFVEISGGGHLFIDGASQGLGAWMNIGNGGMAEMRVLSGGQVLVQGAADRNTYVNIGSFGTGGNGTLLVQGIGSSFTVDGQTSNLSVGGFPGATGLLTVKDQGSVTTGSLLIGLPGSVGQVTVDAATIDVNRGNSGRVMIGNGGNGTLSIASGGVVDGTVNPGACLSAWCANFVGFLAGSTATLSIDGAGSELRVMRQFDVANTWVDSNAGTPGATSDATIAITNGGTLRSNNVVAGSGRFWNGY